MILTQFKIENFRCYRHPTEFCFEPPKDGSKKNIYLIGGLNGAGKTSFLDAIQLCFFGAPDAAAMANNIHRLEREAGNNRIAVSVSYIDDTNHNITLERIWQPRKVRRGLANDDPLFLEEKIILYEDGQQLSSWSPKEIQDWIEGEIPRSTAKFFFFDGEQIQQFAQEEQDSSRLKDSIELLLGIELYRGLKQHLNDYIVKTIRAEASEVFEAEALRLQADIKEIDAQIEKLDEEIEALKSDLTKYKKNEQRLEEQKNGLLKYIDPLARVERDKLEVELGKKQSEFEAVEKRRKEYIHKSFPFVLLLDQLVNLKDALKEERELRITQEVNKKLQSLLNAFATQVFKKGKCVCGVDLTKEDVTKIQAEFVRSAERFIQSSEASKPGLPVFGLSEEQEAAITKTIEEIWSEAGSLKSFFESETDLQRKIEALESQIQGVTPDENISKEFKRLDFESRDVAGLVGRTKSAIEQLENQKGTKGETLEEKEAKLSEAQDRTLKQKKEIAILEKAKAMISLLDEYIDALRKTRLEELETHTTAFFNELQSKASYHGKIKFDENSYTTSIIRGDNRILHKQDLSAGEKELYAVSLIAGLCKTSHKIMPVIIDTPLSRLDSFNRKNVVEKYYPQAGKQVVLLSTDEEVYGRYYEFLREYIQQTFLLCIDPKTESTYIKNGYFGD